MNIIDAHTLNDRMVQGEDIFLLDVREEEEWNLCHIPGDVLIPLAQIPTRMGEIPQDKEIVVYCHSGRRSERAAMYLEQNGYENISNLRGGVDAWAVLVDPTMPRY